MAVSNRLRFEILRRDRFACRYCGARAKEDGAVLELDHVLPKVLGGNDDHTNLVAACVECNGGKSSSHPNSPGIEDVDADALRWRKAIRRVGDEALADITARQEYEEGDQRKPVPRDAEWRGCVEHLYASGLPLWCLNDCIGESMAGNTPHPARFGRMLRLANGRFSDLRGAALLLAPNEEPDEEYTAKDLACELLGCLDDDERERALDIAREDFEDFEVQAMHSAFTEILRQRYLLQLVANEFVNTIGDEAWTQAATAAATEVNREGSPAFDIYPRAALLLLARQKNLSLLKELPADQRDAWLDYVAAWPDLDGEWAMVTRAAELARRREEDLQTGLLGMCMVPTSESPIGRCSNVATHVALVENCGACAEKDRETCHGEHPACGGHIPRLLAGEITSPATGRPIRALSVSAIPVPA
jgi:hypothetical protein